MRLVGNTAYRFLYPFLPVVARGLGVSITEVGFIVSATSLGGVATPFATRLAAERNRRLAAGALALFTVGLVIAAAGGSYVAALVGFTLVGVAKPTYDVAIQSYLSARTSYDRRARVLAILELTWAGALLIGAPIAAWLIDRGSWTTPLWGLAALGALSLLFLPTVVERDVPVPVGVRSPTPRGGVPLLVVMGLFSFGAEVTFVAYGAWLEQDFGLTVLALGGVSTLIGTAELVGSGAVVAFVDRIGKRRAVAIGLVVAAAGFVALPSTTGLLAGLAALAVGILGFEFTIVSAIPLASEIHPEARSRYLSFMVLAVTVSRAAAAALGPYLFTVTAIGANAYLSAAMNLGALAVLLTSVEEPGVARK